MGLDDEPTEPRSITERMMMKRTILTLLAAGVLGATLFTVQSAVKSEPAFAANGQRTCWFLVQRGDGLRRLHGCTQELVLGSSVYQQVTLAVYQADDIHLATDCQTLTLNKAVHFSLSVDTFATAWSGASALGTCRSVWDLPASGWVTCVFGNETWGEIGNEFVGGVGASWRDPAGPHFWYGWKEQTSSQHLTNCTA